jgi:hypothetical protein
MTPRPVPNGVRLDEFASGPGLEWTALQAVLHEMDNEVLADLGRAATGELNSESSAHRHGSLKVLALVDAELRARGVEARFHHLRGDRVFGPPDLPVATAARLIARLSKASCTALAALESYPEARPEAQVARALARGARLRL